MRRPELQEALRQQLSQELNASAADWTLKELRAVENGLAAYKDVLGSENQKLKHVGYLQGQIGFGGSRGEEQRVTTNRAQAAGQAFEEGFVLYKPLPRGSYDATDANRDIGANTAASRRRLDVIHEVAHVLGQEFQEQFSVEMDWMTQTIRGNTPGAEAPPTPYANTTANEYLAETVAHHVAGSGVLQSGTPVDSTGKVNQKMGTVPPHGRPGNPAPQRAAFAARMIAALKQRKQISAVLQAARSRGLPVVP